MYVCPTIKMSIKTLRISEDILDMLIHEKFVF